MLHLSVTMATDATAELRGWITVGWAVIVGAATVVGVWIALRNYLHATHETRVATARLVWAERRGPHYAPQTGSEVRKDSKDPKRPSTFSEIAAPGLFESGEIDGWITRVWKVDGSESYARLTNNSREPVGDVRLELRRAGRVVAKAREPRMVPQTLPPESQRIIAVRLPDNPDTSVFRPGRLVLRFTDSAGNRWERVETRPPRLVPKARSWRRLRGRQFFRSFKR